MKHTHQEEQGFLSEDKIDSLFLGTRGAWFNKTDKNKGRIARWFKKDNDHPFLVPHHEKIGNHFDCNYLVDEWMKWTLTLPAKVNPIITSGEGYGTSNSENQFLFKSGNTSVYFTAASPYQVPEIMRIIVTEKFPILIPVYLTVTSKQENPSLDTEEKLNDLIKKDLGGIKQLDATFDDQDFYGCCVIRNKPLIIPNIPKDNMIGVPLQRLVENDYKLDLHHGGLWLLLKPEMLTSGDHLVWFKANSINYEIEAKIQISALV